MESPLSVDVVLFGHMFGLRRPQRLRDRKRKSRRKRDKNRIKRAQAKHWESLGYDRRYLLLLKALRELDAEVTGEDFFEKNHVKVSAHPGLPLRLKIVATPKAELNHVLAALKASKIKDGTWED